MFYVDYINGYKIVRSDLLSDVEHFFTTRELCIFSKDEDVSENKRIVENHIKQKLVTNKPIHGINIENIVDDKYIYENTDGLLLRKGNAAFINFGDCVPLILCCDRGGIISHAGWRSTAQCMAKHSVKRMINEFCVEPYDIKVVIGPAICKNCYQVGKDVFDKLYNSVNNHNEGFSEFDDKYFVGLKDINKNQLLEVGVKHIDVCPYCTACGEKMFFSYRYEKTGFRHSAVMKL